MKSLFSLAALFFMSYATVQAQEFLFVAKVERVTREPRGGQYCPDRCTANRNSSPVGSTNVCISKDGGCEKTGFVAGRVLFGDMQLGLGTFVTRIGEWG